MLLIVVSLVSCGNDAGYTINIELKELAGEQMNLGQVIENEMVVIDSVVLDSMGVGVLSGSVEAEEMMYLTQAGMRRSIQFSWATMNTRSPKRVRML